MWLDCVLPSELCYDFDALINHGFYGEHIEETVWKKKQCFMSYINAMFSTVDLFSEGEMSSLTGF